MKTRAFSGAVVITSDGKLAFYRWRDTVPDGAQLVQVHSDSISVKGPDGSRYEMFVFLSADKLPSASALRSPAYTPPQAQSPADNDQPNRSTYRRSRRSYSSEV